MARLIGAATAALDETVVGTAAAVGKDEAVAVAAATKVDETCGGGNVAAVA
jgi:hypothetical protein